MRACASSRPAPVTRLRRPRILACLALLLSTGAQAEPVAIVGGRLLTQGPSADIASGTILIDGGRIVAIGPVVEVPAGARIIDAAGKVVTPGFINPAAVNGTGRPSSYNEQPATGDMPIADRIELAFQPDNVDVRESAVDGETAAVLVPFVVRSGVREGKLFAGQAAAVEMSGAPDFLIKGGLGPVFSVGAAMAAGGREAAFPRLERALDDARRAAADAAAGGLRADQRIMTSVIAGERPLLVDVDRASDILKILEIARNQRIRVVLIGAAEGWLVAREIAAAGVPAIVGDANLPADMEQLNATYANAALLDAAGVTIAVAGEGVLGAASRTGRSPRFVAGRLVAHGLDHKAALAAVTIAPARIYGFEGDTGSLEVGKRADLVVWSGDPFEVTSVAEHVFAAGIEPAPPRAALLRDKYKALIDAMPPGGAAAADR